MIDFIEHLTNPETHHTVPPRAEGEKDEQYKARLDAYVQGIKSQQAKVDELQARTDEALKILDGMRHNGAYRAIDILKGNKDEN